MKCCAAGTGAKVLVAISICFKAVSGPLAPATLRSHSVFSVSNTASLPVFELCLLAVSLMIENETFIPTSFPTITCSELHTKESRTAAALWGSR